MNRFTPLLFLIFSFAVVSCRNSESAGSSSGVSGPAKFSKEKIFTMLKEFPVNTIEDLVESISAEEWSQLLSGSENRSWSIEYVKGSAARLQSLIYPDNSVTFSFFSGADVIPVFVQQFNGTNIVTSTWQFSPSTSGWQTMTLPAVPLSDFLAENVSLPDEYDDNAMTYIDMTIRNDSVIYSVNKWALMREIDAVYHSSPDALNTGYVKYFFVLTWDGKTFNKTVRTEDEYNEVLVINSNVLEEDPDGPGLTEFDCPVGVAATASSTLAPQGSYTYDAANVLDRHDETGWSEGKSDDGIGEWIEFTIVDNYLIGHTYQIKPGYAKSANSWSANNRVKKMKAFVNDKLVAIVSFEDVNAYQGFSIIPSWRTDIDTKKGDRIRFVIEEVFPGEKYKDTVVSYFVPTGNCG